jgi:hypothetical protein
MKRVLSLLLVAALAIPGLAYALTAASVPPKFGIPWANGAGAAYVRSIPSSSQIGIQNCAASLPDGFPPLTFVPAAGGGCPPFGQDFNGILRQLSQWNQWQAAGGPVFFDSAFSTAIGGYPNGAVLNSTITPGTTWMSTIDNNTNNPDGATPTGWIQEPGQIPIGTPVQSLSTTIPTGYISANGLTIGDGSSNATNRAAADTQFLFTFVWNNCPVAQCPIYTSLGSGSTKTTAAADFSAHKQLAVWNMNGAGLMGADNQNGTTSTNLSSVPVVIGSRTAPGSILGENLHTLVSAENGQHNHAITEPNGGLGHNHSYNLAINSGGTAGGGGLSPFYNYSGTTTGNTVTGITINNSPVSATTPHNTVARSLIVYWNLKL